VDIATHPDLAAWGARQGELSGQGLDRGQLEERRER